MKNSRRDFLKFFGRTAALAYIGTQLAPLETVAQKLGPLTKLPLPLVPLMPTDADDLVLTKGLSYYVIAKWGDKINATEQFGMHNDFVAFFPTKKDEALLWVNHEYTHPMFVSGYEKGKPRTQQQVEQEMKTVGGSIIKVKKNKKNNCWEMVANDPLNRRITAATEIPFAWHEPILGATTAVGTLANCAGGQTPWGTALTCEENYDMFYGETDYTSDIPKHIPSTWYGWDEFFKYPPEHYGWVVEIDMQTGKAKKLVSLGRFSHEAATVWQLPDKRCVVYSGDDKEDEHLYKFIASEPNSLEKGKLYVANLEKGEWVSLDITEQPVLREKFKSQTEVLIRCREAAKLVGATPLNRPEDIEFDPVTKDIFVCLTNNKKKGDLYGSILRITEKEGKEGLKFESKTFLAGGKDTNFACPDNMVFDKKGNLWFTSDMSGSVMNKGEYQTFKNNGLFLVPMSGPEAGRALQVASAPTDAEFTGPCFSEDGKTLFLCVQHPGEQSKSLTELTSHWPDKGQSIPKSALVGIHGNALDKLLG